MALFLAVRPGAPARPAGWLRAAAVALIGRFLHERVVRTRHRIDVVGALLVLLAAGALIFGLLQGGVAWAWRSPPSVAVFAVAAAAAPITAAPAGPLAGTGPPAPAPPRPARESLANQRGARKYAGVVTRWCTKLLAPRPIEVMRHAPGQRGQ